MRRARPFVRTSVIRMHAASPFPIAQPQDADGLLRPAVDGMRRAMLAAHRAGIGRVIVTSPTVAVAGAQRLRNGKSYTGADGTRPGRRGRKPYTQAGRLAEKAR